jgi:hypothetical protein
VDLHGVLEKVRQNPFPLLATCIRELKTDLMQEGDRHAWVELDFKETLKGAHGQIQELGEQRACLIEEKKKLLIKLKGEFFPPL